MTGLCRAGFIEEIRRDRVKHKAVMQVFYRLINDVGHQAPCVDRKGNIKQPRQVNQTMWNTLRICHGAITPRQLAQLATTDDRQVSENTANCYLQDLHKAGYVSLVSKANHLKQASYQLLAHKNTGAKPPQITRACRVYDPNLGEVVYQEQPELAEELRDGLNNGDLSHA